MLNLNLRVKKRTEELDYVTLHLVPLNEEVMSGEIFFKTDIDNPSKVGDLVTIQNQSMVDLRSDLEGTQEVLNFLLMTQMSEGGM